MSINEMITKDYDKYLQFAKNMSNGKDDPYDILNECLMEICSMPDEKQQRIILQYKKIDYYLIQMIKYSYQSKTSKYQQKYNKLVLSTNKDSNVESDGENDFGFNQKVILTNEENINPFFIFYFEDIEKVLEEKCKDWYVRNVFMTYAKSGLSFSKFSKKTNIPVSSLYKAYKDACDIIRNHLKVDYDN